MQRKWRTNPGALDSVLPYHTFRDSIPPRDAEYTLADPTDLYSVYTVLHIESKRAELRWSPQGRFYFFLAQWQQAQAEQGQPAQQAAAPEGDEDPPPQIVPEGSEAALRLEAAAGTASGDGSGAKAGADASSSGQQQQQQQARDAAEEPPPQQQCAGARGAEHEQQQGAGAASTEGQPPEAAAAPGAAAAPLPPKLRTQILVPLSSSYQQLTPQLLQRLFSVRGVQAQQLLLALVDSNGVVTRSCLYNYIQAPLEGPGTANLELLDD